MLIVEVGDRRGRVSIKPPRFDCNRWKWKSLYIDSINNGVRFVSVFDDAIAIKPKSVQVIPCAGQVMIDDMYLDVDLVYYLLFASPGQVSTN